MRPFFDKREGETEGKGGDWGPTFTGTRILPSQGPVCIDVDKSRTAINHRFSRGKREREREKGGKFSVCIAVTVDRASSPPYLYHRLIMDHYPRALCSPVERTRRARIRIRGRIHGLFKGFSLSLCLFLSLSRARTRTRRRTDARVTVLREGSLLLRILGRGILSQRCDETRTRAINHLEKRI